MNHFVKATLLTLSVVGLAACEDLSGTITVKKPLTVTTKKADKVVPAGSYSVGITMKSSNKMQVKVKGLADGSLKFDLNVPAGIPSYSGAFTARAGENGQKFNVAGEVKTADYQGQPERRTRTCQYPIEREYCHMERVEECGVNHHGERVCKTREVPVCRRVIEYVDGHEMYEGHYSYHDQYMKASLVDATTGEELGAMDTGDHDSYWNETWRSGCVIGRVYP